jgi:hypothetical protein
MENDKLAPPGSPHECAGRFCGISRTLSCCACQSCFDSIENVRRYGPARRALAAIVASSGADEGDVLALIAVVAE